MSSPSSTPTFGEWKSAKQLVLGWLGTIHWFPGEAGQGAWAGDAGARGAGRVAWGHSDGQEVNRDTGILMLSQNQVSARP